MSSLALCFNDVNFEVIDQNGSPWIKSRELAIALGYADEKSVNRIYQRNSDEFTDQMVGGVKLTPGDMKTEVRIFSLRGCYAIAMFARTAIAKQFRKWVLDILDKLVGSLPKITLTTKEQRNPLKDAVTLLVSKTRNLSYPDAYSMVHQAMGVQHIDEIPLDRLGEAVRYVHGLVGEYIPYEKPTSQPSIDDKTREAIYEALSSSLMMIYDYSKLNHALSTFNKDRSESNSKRIGDVANEVIKLSTDMGLKNRSGNAIITNGFLNFYNGGGMTMPFWFRNVRI